MISSLKIGKKKITPRRVVDKNGLEGFFISKKDWLVLVKETESEPLNKSLLPGTLRALKEVESFLLGKKELKNAKKAIEEL